MLDAAKACTNTSAFILTSSCCVISDNLDQDHPNMNENSPIGKAIVAYGQSKVSSRLLLSRARIHFRYCVSINARECNSLAVKSL
jgi:sterol-4alpha-carboxylate 3-dehydrogenase (decarboxylating)